MTSIRDVLSSDALYIKILPILDNKKEWDGEIDVSLVCPNDIPLDEEGKDILLNMGALMSVSLLLYEENLDIKEAAEDILASSSDGTYLLGDDPKPTPRVVSTEGNVVKINFGKQ